ncbi:hypothetical protein [uncultured Zobellia sp.]|uniref:hypothetical protein n=1 Tax=uncultured Zobellia sp. TaxID=255433 RepID=UPI00259898A9|nr:hypothetical protein [uncultured Zobellia sp.]
MKKISLLVLLAMHVSFTISCSDDDAITTTEDGVEVTDESNEETEDDEVYVESYADSDFEASDWTDATHSKSADPNFDVVFEDNTVKRLDLFIVYDR